jgi:hypothetical protein
VRKLLLVAATLSLVGCANTELFRVVEYGGGGAVGLFTGELGGCSVYQTPSVGNTRTFEFVYTSEKCAVRIRK